MTEDTKTGLAVLLGLAPFMVLACCAVLWSDACADRDMYHVEVCQYRLSHRTPADSIKTYQADRFCMDIDK